MGVTTFNLKNVVSKMLFFPSDLFILYCNIPLSQCLQEEREKIHGNHSGALCRVKLRQW